MAETNKHGKMVQVRDRKPATREELLKAFRGLLLVSVDVLRSADEVRAIDGEWIEDNVRFSNEKWEQR